MHHIVGDGNCCFSALHAQKQDILFCDVGIHIEADTANITHQLRLLAVNKDKACR